MKKEFYNISGVPIIINTLFNMTGEPIVESPYDAVKTFVEMDLDYLVCGDIPIEKNN